MNSQPRISELWCACLRWAISRGANRICDLEGLWEGETEDWEIAINGHGRECEQVPAYTVRLMHKKLLIVGLIAPTRGIICGPPGQEIKLIDHLQQRTVN